ncbi:MAG TPA: asparagine synthase (glutamine-hydrolyzing), partial [Saprospiraceae bacterium]|nr:asparagine synthase (glutamine-hydrolyzing) [Saprospiraceae bacterium]
FNYRKLRSELEGSYPFKTLSDTEVILQSYRKWGKGCCEHLEGQFAFAIWDGVEQSLFFARDRMGEKPFYYSLLQENQGFIFASAINVLTSSGLISNEISKNSLAEYFRYQSVTQPQTIFEEVWMLEAGCYGLWKNGQITISKYYELKGKDAGYMQSLNYHQIKSGVKELLFAAVEKQMMSDVPLGAFLSGGIDSSAVVAVMSQLSDEKPRTFNIGFKEASYDESFYAATVAQKFNTKHEKITLSGDDLIAKIPSILSKMNGLSGDGPNTYIVSEAVKEAGITVALSGLGGDDLFAGYDNMGKFKAIDRYSFLWQIPQPIRKTVANTLVKSGVGAKYQKLATYGSKEKHNLADFYCLTRAVFSEDEIRQLLGSNNDYPDHLNVQTKEILSSNKNLPLLGQYGIAELNGYTRNVLLKDADAMSMANSLEIRVPFFDHHLMEFALGVPDKYKYDPNFPKKLLVESLDGLLPMEIVMRKKMGFSFPWDRWLRNELASFVEEKIQSLLQRNVVDHISLNKMYADFKSGSNNVTWIKIWLIVVLESFLEKNI